VTSVLGGPAGVLANMFYLQDLAKYQTVIGVAWTLCLEIQFYLTFIFLMYWAQRLQHPLKSTRYFAARSDLALLIVFLPLTLFSYARWFPGLLDFTFFGTWFRFALGVITLWTTRKMLSPLWLFLLVSAALILGLWAHDPRGVTAGLTAASIWAAFQFRQMGSWLSARPFQYLGKISYSLYLSHVLFGVNAAGFIWSLTNHSALAALLMVPTGVLISIACAEIVYRLYEAPSVDLSKLLKGKRD
jgi:peptidoglycan/LPS O-acetylase OafA/YrhL